MPTDIAPHEKISKGTSRRNEEEVRKIFWAYLNP